MIPFDITKGHIDQAIRRILRDGVPRSRRARNYCLVVNGRHLPPKYTIALAHEVATGQPLSSERFGGGSETNGFLRPRGFDVVVCGCRGNVRDGSKPAIVDGPSGNEGSIVASTRHSERCRECKKRVRELLECIYGSCVTDHRFNWPTGLSPYRNTSIYHKLRNVATALQQYRGFGIGEFVRRDVLSGCDYWVPDPGFIVEFDESQHFTIPRKLALSAVAGDKRLGFSTERWITLCEHHNARDNDPPFRDEQRAWYDVLRDLVPSVKGLRPTVRLYASDCVWCSLDPDRTRDRDRFLEIMFRGSPASSGTVWSNHAVAAGPRSTLSVAMVFPEVTVRSNNGVPPSGSEAQRPSVPTSASFHGEPIDFVLFPEGYISATDDKRKAALQKLALELDAPLLVGAVDKSLDDSDRAWQVLLRFESDGSRPSRIYVKHSTADAVAFERQDWAECDALPTFDLSGVTAGATICHDHYLGLLPRSHAKRGALLWVNPSFDNVTERKWSSVLRLRAVENRFFALCTSHSNGNARRKTHPFAFSPDGAELSARQAGSDIVRPISECSEAGSVYIVSLKMDAAGQPLDWSRLPPAKSPKQASKGVACNVVHVALRGGEPSVLGCSGWKSDERELRVETEHGPAYVGVLREERILDATACFGVIDQARKIGCAPIIWNHWKQLPAESAKLASLMMGRAIECCAPIVISDQSGVCELIELSNRNKIPVRRIVEPSGLASLDIRYAWGLKSAFKMVKGKLPRNMSLNEALSRYRSLCLRGRLQGESKRLTKSSRYQS